MIAAFSNAVSEQFPDRVLSGTALFGIREPKKKVLCEVCTAELHTGNTE